MNEEQTQTQFNGYALVEIMGHRRAAGMVTTEYIGAAAFLRVVTPEVPATRITLDRDAWVDGTMAWKGSIVEVSRPRTEILIGSGSIYAISPIDEADVLQHAPTKQKVIVLAERKAIMGPAESQDDSDRREPTKMFANDDDDDDDGTF